LQPGQLTALHAPPISGPKVAVLPWRAPVVENSLKDDIVALILNANWNYDTVDAMMNDLEGGPDADFSGLEVIRKQC
jgi:hypothetical protein